MFDSGSSYFLGRSHIRLAPNIFSSIADGRAQIELSRRKNVFDEESILYKKFSDYQSTEYFYANENNEKT